MSERSANGEYGTGGALFIGVLLVQAWPQVNIARNTHPGTQIPLTPPPYPRYNYIGVPENENHKGRLERLYAAKRS